MAIRFLTRPFSRMTTNTIATASMPARSTIATTIAPEGETSMQSLTDFSNTVMNGLGASSVLFRNPSVTSKGSKSIRSEGRAVEACGKRKMSTSASDRQALQAPRRQALMQSLIDFSNIAMTGLGASSVLFRSPGPTSGVSGPTRPMARALDASGKRMMSTNASDHQGMAGYLGAPERRTFMQTLTEFRTIAMNGLGASSVLFRNPRRTSETGHAALPEDASSGC